MAIEPPYLMFLGDAQDQLAAKTAQGVAQWRPEWCLGQLRLPGCRADIGIPDMSVAEAAEKGARTLVVGVANRGGIVAPAWVPILVEAMDRGMDIANGLHQRMTEIPEIRDAAATRGRQLHDVRHPDRTFDVATGEKRPGRRLLAVGTDCSVGKMYVALAMWKDMQARGLKVSFRATGQTGILIAGDGVSVDAVIADFISGAVEWLSPANDDDHWDIVEGQGSLHHPSFAAVSTGLLHGAQPDALILSHEPTRDHMRGLPHFPIPSLEATLEANLQTARLVNPAVRAVGASINTRALGEDDARRCIETISRQLGLPATDPVRFGVGPLVDALP